MNTNITDDAVAFRSLSVSRQRALARAARSIAPHMQSAGGYWRSLSAQHVRSLYAEVSR